MHVDLAQPGHHNGPARRDTHASALDPPLQPALGSPDESPETPPSPDIPQHQCCADTHMPHKEQDRRRHGLIRLWDGFSDNPRRWEPPTHAAPGGLARNRTRALPPRPQSRSVIGQHQRSSKLRFESTDQVRRSSFWPPARLAACGPHRRVVGPRSSTTGSAVSGGNIRHHG